MIGDIIGIKMAKLLGKIAINLTNETIMYNEHTYCVRLTNKVLIFTISIIFNNKLG